MANVQEFENDALMVSSENSAIKQVGEEVFQPNHRGL